MIKPGYQMVAAALVAAFLSPMSRAQTGQAAAATTLYYGGPIITMDGDRPMIVEAVVTRGDRIAFVGNEPDARRFAGDAPLLHNLRGGTMLPGFIDAHSHFSIALQRAGSLDLSDPAHTPPTSIAALQQRLTNFVAVHAVPAGDWVVVWQYDQETLAEKRHITRAEIDAILPDHKVVLLHVSLHGLVGNSAALTAAKIDEATPVPAGGIMLRDADGRLNGALFESALYLMLAALPKPTTDQKLAAIDAAQSSYFAEGFTHAQDGATQPADLEFFTSDAARARLRIDLALLPLSTQLDALLAKPDPQFGVYQGHVKVQGVKFVLDGSPQARTAFFTRDYARGSPDGTHPWHGAPIISAAAFAEQARKAHGRGWQLFVHANGDAAIDMAISAFDALGITAAGNRRPIVIHSQFQRRDHLADYARIGVGPAYFSNHSWYWADIHRSNFPTDVVDFISPLRSARAAGLTPSNHSDYSVTPLDTRFQMWTAMARVSPTGVVSGPDERVDAYAALQALTTGPAWQIFEDDRKGRIRVGLLADFVVLDKNPLAAPIDVIKGIKVVETIKQGETVWHRAPVTPAIFSTIR